MNRRFFLQHFAGAFLALNVTLGPTKVFKLPEPESVLVDNYRMVVPMLADGDINLGCFVTRDGEKVRRAMVSDRIFGIAEESVHDGQRVFVCVSGVANTTWAK